MILLLKIEVVLFWAGLAYVVAEDAVSIVERWHRRRFDAKEGT